jgi:Protein of unknown function (DUF1616)
VTRTAATVAVAALCAVLVGTTGGAVRLVAGLVLCLYLPGRLAVEALFPCLDPVLRVVLAAALSLGTTMAVGLAVAASGLGFRAGTVAGALFGCCLLFAAGTWRHRGLRRGRMPTLPRPGWHWLAAVPAVLLGILLVVQVGAAARYQPARYTELALVQETPLAATVAVDSREAGPVGYRYEERADGVVRHTVRFALAPGQRRQFAVSRAGAGRIEVRLYRGDDGTPYRYLVF